MIIWGNEVLKRAVSDNCYFCNSHSSYTVFCFCKLSNVIKSLSPPRSNSFHSCMECQEICFLKSLQLLPQSLCLSHSSNGNKVIIIMVMIIVIMINSCLTFINILLTFIVGPLRHLVQVRACKTLLMSFKA